MFQKILIANRGEIACRVIRTAHRLGMRCIAVYSDADRDAMHVALADEAYRLGPPPVAESYLRTERIIEIALASGAEAIHPGYGFLSENPDFVDACDARRITFIGPPAAAIRAMGLKDQAKRLMEDAGVPVVPGYHGAEQDRAALAAHADGDRLSGADQGARRRRRQGHAGGAGRAGVRRRAGERPARGGVELRRRPRAAREVPTRAPPHRDPGVRRPPRPGRAPVRARLLAAAPPSEGDRGGAGPRHAARDARRDGQRRGARRRGDRLCRRRHDRVHRRRRGRARPRALLLHGDEHAPPGRAPGDRADHRHRPRRVAAAHRGRRAAAAAASTSSRSTAMRSRRGSMPRIRPRGFLPSTGRLRHLAMPPASRAGPDRHRHPRGRRRSRRSTIR